MAEMLFTIAVGIVLVSMLLSAARFAMGPTVVDRIVAFDGLTVISISLIAAIALLAKGFIYLDVALVYGLLSFLGVIAAARYLERGI